MAQELVCYQCFRKFKPYQVWFRCQNPAREDNQTEFCPPEMDSKLKQMKRRAFPLQGVSAALGSLFKDPLHGFCDKCGYRSTIRLCPHCHWDLPPGFGQLAEHIIAVIGNTNSGKSHYFTVLIESELKGLIGYQFGTSVNPADDETRNLFTSEYYNPLFVDKHTIPPTTIEERRHRRLMFRLQVDKLKRKLTFVFYDIAGELLTRAAGDTTPTNATRYLWNSSGIIYLVNPSDVRALRPFLNGAGGLLDNIAAAPPDGLFGKILEELRMHKEIKAVKRVPIPMAVCISQFDKLRNRANDAGIDEDLFNPASTPVGMGHIDDKKICKESDAIKEFMVGNGLSNLVTQAEQNFIEPRFFAASALGSSPAGPNQEVPVIVPNRVSVPFFWILQKLSKKKGARR